MAALTYLQLAQKLQQKCGVSGSPMTTCQGQTGENARIAAWIDEAYLNIQQVHATWQWMRKVVTFDTIDGQYSYTPAQCGVTDLAEWKMNSFRRYIVSVGVRSEVFLSEIEYDTFRDVYIYGNMRLVTGDPISISQGPDMSLNLGLTPGSVGYTVVGEYYKEPVSLVDDTDTPEFPARFHMLCVYRAMMMYGMYQAANEVYQEGLSLYNAMIRRMNRDQLEDVTIGSALV